jgi:hypothetical protein
MAGAKTARRGRPPKEEAKPAATPEPEVTVQETPNEPETENTNPVPKPGHIFCVLSAEKWTRDREVRMLQDPSVPGLMVASWKVYEVPHTDHWKRMQRQGYVILTNDFEAATRASDDMRRNHWYPKPQKSVYRVFGKDK